MPNALVAGKFVIRLQLVTLKHFAVAVVARRVHGGEQPVVLTDVVISSAVTKSVDLTFFQRADT